MNGERAQKNIPVTFSISSWEQPIHHTKLLAASAPSCVKKSSDLLEKLKGTIDQIPSEATFYVPTDPIYRPKQSLKTWLKVHWLAWKVEFTASRLMRTVLHAPTREVAVGLLNICRLNIGQMPASVLRDALYIYTDLAANRVDDRFGEAA